MKRYDYSEPAYGKDVCDRILFPMKSSIRYNCYCRYLKVNKIHGFSKLHNFTYDDKGLRVWRAYDIGPGKLIPFGDVVVEQQEVTALIVQENGDFSP